MIFSFLPCPCRNPLPSRTQELTHPSPLPLRGLGVPSPLPKPQPLAAQEVRYPQCQPMLQNIHFYFQPPWGYNLKNFRAHQSLRETVLEQVEFVLYGLLRNVVQLSPSSPKCPVICPFFLTHIRALLCLPDFAHKVVPISRQVCGVEGDEIIRGRAPFSLAPSEKEVLWK